MNHDSHYHPNTRLSDADVTTAQAEFLRDREHFAPTIAALRAACRAHIDALPETDTATLNADARDALEQAKRENAGRMLERASHAISNYELMWIDPESAKNFSESFTTRMNEKANGHKIAAAHLARQAIKHISF